MADPPLLLYAIKDGCNLEAVKKLVENGASVNSHINFEYPLDAAVEVNNAEIVNYLLEHVDYDINNQYPAIGKSILHFACEADSPNIEIIKNLLDHGMKVNIDYYGETALNYACERGAKDVVQLLISYGADVNFFDETNDLIGFYPPIYSACFKHFSDIVELLLLNGAQVLTVSSRLLSILQYALTAPTSETAKLLLKHVANLSSTVELNWTELSCAVYDRNLKLTKELLKNEHEIDMLTLYSATVCGNNEILKLIWDNIAPDIVSNDLCFMVHVFDNWKLEDCFEKLMLLLNKEDVDLHLERCGRAFAFLIDRWSFIDYRININEHSQVIERLVTRGLRLDSLDVERIINIAQNKPLGRQLFEIIIEKSLPKISKQAYCRGLEWNLGTYLIQYCLETDADLLLSSEEIFYGLDFINYWLGIYTISDECKNYVSEIFRERGDRKQTERVNRILGMMNVKSLLELSRDAVRSHLSEVCIDAREFLDSLQKLRLPEIVKDLIQCKMPVNRYVYHLGANYE